MSHHSPFTRTLSLGLFMGGLLLALALTLVALWPDLEASLFDSALGAERSLENLRCPIVVTPADAAAIQATFTNPFDRPVQFVVRANITQGFVSLQREEDTLLQLAPGEEATLSWPIAPQDAAYERLILARIFAFRSAPLPARARTCGILVVNNPLVSGKTIVAGAVSLSLLSLGVGAALWLGSVERQRWAAGHTAGRLAFLILLALGASLLGWWAVSLVLLLLLLLLLAVLLERYLLGR